MTATRLLSPRRREEPDSVAVARELSRALAALVGAVRGLAGHAPAQTQTTSGDTP